MNPAYFFALNTHRLRPWFALRKGKSSLGKVASLLCILLQVELPVNPL